jgi:hypothetical protein
MVIGTVTFITGFLHRPEQTWANYLLNNYYFLSLAIGASFFMSLQYITQSGWSAGFKRVSEAMASYIPVAAVFFVVLYFGMHTIYHWSHPEGIEQDSLLQHKSTYLNVPFFFLRLVAYFICWILMTRYLRKASLKEDEEGGLTWFHKSEFLSRVYIFILAVTFSLACFDLIMSIDPHWYSTIFAFKNFAAAFYHGAAIILLIVVILNKNGHFTFFNRNHLQDFSSYIFMLSIIYGYLWFAQFMLIWYGNIPEETIYYAIRWEHQWKVLFWADILVNWFIPFAFLMPKKPARRLKVVVPIILLLIAGQWISQYLQIFPGITGENNFGLLEVGCFMGYAGLFTFIVARALASAPLVPRNHPYLGECMDHHIA